MSTIAGSGHAETARLVATRAAAVTAGLYFLIGLGVLDVGDPTRPDSAPNIVVFGAMTGLTFTATAILLYFLRSRVLWIGVAALQVLVLVGYVAISSSRTPPYEIWGLLVKALQVVILVAVGYLLVQPRART